MKPLHQQMIEKEGALEFRTPASPTVKLGAVGDLAFHGFLLEKISPRSTGYVFEKVAGMLQAVDVAVGNLESVLVRHPFSPLSSKANLVSGLGALEDLREAGFKVLTFANNHVADAGPEGLVECLDAISHSGLLTTGAGRTPEEARQPVRLSAGNINFVFFAYSYGCGQIARPNQPGCNESKLADIVQDVKEFSSPTDIKVVSLHMDAEFQSTPAPDRMDFCRRLAAQGVQIVLCHHPHVPQGVEFIDGSLIAYSLGNFVFPMTDYLLASSPDCGKSFFLEVEVDQTGPVGARIVPVYLDDTGRPDLPTESGNKELLAMVAERSSFLQDSQVVRRHYRDMTSRYTRSLARNLYWALGERDWRGIRLYLDSLRFSSTHRGWVRHFFRDHLPGRKSISKPKGTTGSLG